MVENKQQQKPNKQTNKQTRKQQQKKEQKKKKKTLVVTTQFSLHLFTKGHIFALSWDYEIYICYMFSKSLIKWMVEIIEPVSKCFALSMITNGNDGCRCNLKNNIHEKFSWTLDLSIAQLVILRYTLVTLILYVLNDLNCLLTMTVFCYTSICIIL